jgi:hypothetical protein
MTFSLPRFCRHIFFFSRREQLERELAEEIEFHRALKQNDPAMGNITLAKEESRDIAAIASSAPALRAAQMDPLKSLRVD